VQYVILCEDLQTQVFIRRALIRRGANPRRIRPVALPSADKGAGDAYVVKHYPQEAQAHRSQVARSKAALVVHLDADPANTVAARMSRLDAALVAAGMSPRGPGERISYLVPKRNIETWIHFYLDGPPIDESTEYPKYGGRESDCGPAAETFADHAVSNTVPLGAPPSLVTGLSEFRRVI
jgi:hypothetical protein